jgi:hypothetical protein
MPLFSEGTGSLAKLRGQYRPCITFPAMVDFETRVRTLIFRHAVAPGAPLHPLLLTDANQEMAGKLYQEGLLEKPEVGDVQGTAHLALRLTPAGVIYLKTSGR